MNNKYSSLSVTLSLHQRGFLFIDI